MIMVNMKTHLIITRTERSATTDITSLFCGIKNASFFFRSNDQILDSSFESIEFGLAEMLTSPLSQVAVFTEAPSINKPLGMTCRLVSITADNGFAGPFLKRHGRLLW
jgi:hypothetical protein